MALTIQAFAIGSVPNAGLNDDKLIPAKSGDNVSGTSDGAEPVGDRTEQHIASIVAECVVCLLETVKVQVMNRDLWARLLEILLLSAKGDVNSSGDKPGRRSGDFLSTRDAAADVSWRHLEDYSRPPFAAHDCKSLAGALSWNR